MEQIQSYLAGIGTIRKHGKDHIQYEVDSLKDLTQVIIPHFDRYTLMTQKQADFLLFKSIVQLMSDGEHLKNEGLIKIVSIKASMNLGLSETLKAAFPDVKPVQRPVVQLPESIDGHWLAGFVDAEGCFIVNTSKSKTKIGLAVTLKFNITQHTRDLALLNSLIKFFGCGLIKLRPTGSACDFYVIGLPDIISKIIPFLSKYPLQGAKRLDYADFCKVAYIMGEKAHLKQDGLRKLKK